MESPVVVDVALTALVRGSMPFASVLGVEVISGSKVEVRARMAWQQELCTAGGAMHGGALMAFADTVGAFLAFSNLPAGALGTTTIESKTNFLRGVSAGFVNAVSQPLHVGRTTIVVDTDLFDDAGRRVARVTQTQAVLNR